MEGAEGASKNATKYKKRKPPVQRWRPISTEATSQKDDVNKVPNSRREQVTDNSITSNKSLASGGITNVVIEVSTNDASSSENNIGLESSSTKVVVEDNVEISGLNKGPDGSDISERYSSCIETWSVYPVLIGLLVLFQVDVPLMRFVKGKGGFMQNQIEEETGVRIMFPSSKEDTTVVLEGKSAESIRKASEKIANVLEQAVQSRMLDYSHFISLPLAIHSDLVDKLNHFQRSILGASASYEDSDNASLSEGSADEMDHDQKHADKSSVSIKLQVQEEEAVRVKINTKGSVSEIIIDAFVKSGLVLERDAKQELKLHATIMNVRHRKSKKRNQWNDSFDARDIFRKYGKEEWGEYHIPEVHLSQRFKFDESVLPLLFVDPLAGKYAK
ncbi:hypothetical protein PR202_ga24276 [Eleusine coracana subsp. coracana]|uniref:K Homology domain-containing protein n=1 Tax=Eleusine coracana subsp. coracana TaxID=191504 RepID=A0AAV5D8G2_ELECO|nr:hypothetical protein PR202_ga24276 [Eleusine coracana subsp. coracana]